MQTPWEREMTWVNYQDYLDFKRSELAGTVAQYSDYFENMLHPYAVRLGYEAWFSTNSPWAIETRIQIRNSCGSVMTENTLNEVLAWLNEQAFSIRSLENARREKRALDAEASQCSFSCSLPRL